MNNINILFTELREPGEMRRVVLAADGLSVMLGPLSDAIPSVSFFDTHPL